MNAADGYVKAELNKLIAGNSSSTKNTMKKVQPKKFNCELCPKKFATKIVVERASC